MQCARKFMNVILTFIIHKVMLEVFFFITWVFLHLYLKKIITSQETSLQINVLSTKIINTHNALPVVFIVCAYFVKNYLANVSI